MILPRVSFCRSRVRLVSLLVLLLAFTQPWLEAAEWFVATNGLPANSGTEQSPWDITSALRGRTEIQAGDTLWLRAGRFKHPFENAGMGFSIQLAGRSNAPIQLRAYLRERVTIDGGLKIEPPSTFLWVRDLEITVSEPRPAQPVPPDPAYRNVNRPWGGLNVYSGEGCKFINLVIHDNSQGVSWWSASTSSEMYGCILYDNGWRGTDRGHGHAIYTQNNQGTKTIADCIFTGGFGYSLHAYGSSRADVNNYLATGNIAYAAGTFLIGGGKPSHGIRVLTNFFFNTPLQLGYSAPDNEDLELRGNILSRSTLAVKGFRRVVEESNWIQDKMPARTTPLTVLRANRYDTNRAHLAIFNFAGASAVEVDLSSFLNQGDRFELRDPRDIYGRPLFSGHSATHLTLPLAGEFAAFVILRLR